MPLYNLCPYTYMCTWVASLSGGNDLHSFYPSIITTCQDGAGQEVLQDLFCVSSCQPARWFPKTQRGEAKVSEIKRLECCLQWIQKGQHDFSAKRKQQVQQHMKFGSTTLVNAHTVGEAKRYQCEVPLVSLRLECLKACRP